MTDHCSQCECIGGANVTNVLIANGFCNDETNTADCSYDGGDCCVNINTDDCSNCTCYHQENCLLGFTPSVVGDGFCHDETNNADCNFDGGDCCIKTGMYFFKQHRKLATIEFSTPYFM